MVAHLTESVEQAADYLRNRGVSRVDAAIVLGTGLSAASILHQITFELPYSEIPGMPASTVEGHDGMLIFGEKRWFSCQHIINHRTLIIGTISTKLNQSAD